MKITYANTSNIPFSCIIQRTGDIRLLKCSVGVKSQIGQDSKMTSSPFSHKISDRWHECMLSHFSCVQLFVTTWTAARQAPLSMEFSGQDYWSGLPRPPPGDLPNPGIKPVSLTSPALAAGFLTTSATREAQWTSHLSPINKDICLLVRMKTSNIDDGP